MAKTIFEEYKEQLIEETESKCRKETRIETTIEYYKDGLIPAEKAAEKIGISVEDFLEKYGK